MSAAPAPVTSVVDDISNPHVANTQAAIRTDAAPEQRVSYVRAERRDTPYSIARRLFPDNVDRARDEIVELNDGRRRFLRHIENRQPGDDWDYRDALPPGTYRVSLQYEPSTTDEAYYRGTPRTNEVDISIGN